MVHVALHYFDLTLNCSFQDLCEYKHECICIIFLLIPLNHSVCVLCRYFMMLHFVISFLYLVKHCEYQSSHIRW